MEDGKFNQTVENEVEKRLNENKIKDIISQIKKLSVILGIVGVGLIILGLVATNFSIFTAIYYFIFGLIYLVLAVFLFTKKTKTPNAYNRIDMFDIRIIFSRNTNY